MQECEKTLLAVIEAEGIAIEAGDINRTGLIGPEWTPLTTSQGILEAKRTSLDPNFAALLVRYFKEAGLEAGDHVPSAPAAPSPGCSLPRSAPPPSWGCRRTSSPPTAPPCTGRRARR